MGVGVYMLASVVVVGATGVGVRVWLAIVRAVCVLGL